MAYTVPVKPATGYCWAVYPLKIDESPVFAQIRETKAEESRPLVEVIRDFHGIVVKGCALSLLKLAHLLCLL